MLRFLPTVVAMLVTVVLATKAVVGFMAFMREPRTGFTGPGEFRFSVKEPSNYTLWHHTSASIEGAYTVRDARLPTGATITVVREGSIIPTKTAGGATMSGTEGGDRVSVLSFTAGQPGDYLIAVTGLAETHAFTITRGSGIGPVFASIGWFLAAIIAGMMSVGFLILALARLFPKSIPPVV